MISRVAFLAKLCSYRWAWPAADIDAVACGNFASGLKVESGAPPDARSGTKRLLPDGRVAWLDVFQWLGGLVSQPHVDLHLGARGITGGGAQ